MSEQKAVYYLGKKLFELYREKHPEVTEETKAEQIKEEQMEYGFRILKPGQYYRISEPLLPTAYKLETIDILPKQFEKWAENKDGKFHRIAYVQETDTIYVFSYYPRY